VLSERNYSRGVRGAQALWVGCGALQPRCLDGTRVGSRRCGRLQASVNTPSFRKRSARFRKSSWGVRPFSSPRCRSRASARDRAAESGS